LKKVQRLDEIVGLCVVNNRVLFFG